KASTILKLCKGQLVNSPLFFNRFVTQTNS
ncbi:MAG: hypothetical protein ACI9GM_000090, partial [Salibacteraceae bacterium]